MVFKEIITKGSMAWFVFSSISVLFAMASITTDGSMRYVYLLIAYASCYGIKILSSKVVKNGKTINR